MKFKILIVGCGGIGSRYIQGLTTSRLELSIRVVDPSEVSLNSVRNWWNKRSSVQTGTTIEFYSDLCKLGPVQYFDLIVIATSAYGRADLVKHISNLFPTRFWIIEKVLSQSREELGLLLEATSNAENCWVNTPRRLMAWHRAIRDRIKDTRPIDVYRSGLTGGLACNAIHFIDLVSWWTSETIVSVRTNLLASSWVPSKRAGYYEVDGTLIVNFHSGSRLILSSFGTDARNLVDSKSSNRLSVMLEEAGGFALLPKQEIISGRIELQSEITGPMVERLLNVGKCDLPTLSESIVQHQPLLESLIHHWNFSNKRNDLRVPIT